MKINIEGKFARVGPMVFKIHTVEDLAKADGTKLDGQIEFAPSMIFVEKNLSTASTILTIWHEMAHAMCEQYSIAADEALVNSISCALMDAIMDNEWLVRATLKIKREDGKT
jgi:hypothetical protein